MNLFSAAMLLLVTGANYLILFIGWEGVGLCSYLLIGFWFKNDAYNLAARKAFIMNRIGDLGFILGVILIFFTFRSLSFAEVFSQLGSFNANNTTIIIITLLLLVGALGKSAQIPLFTWLPDAMAGPTPVSALIHAATMVTAGIYLIARSSLLFNLAPFTLDVILGIGLVTALFAATIGIYQNDIKKVLAYSTVSQLGYMFIALGLGVYSTAVFHLTTHAFFKALLFLGAGSIIHAMGGEQDIRKMGGLKKKLPITYLTFFIATLAISGFPPFSGFFSKDEILMAAFERNPIIYILGLLGALMTCFYMFRLLFLVFYSNFRGTAEQQHHLHESPAIMTIPLLALAALSVFGGLINIPVLFGGSTAHGNYLSFSIKNAILHEGHLSHSTELLLLATSVILLILIVMFAYQQFIRKNMVPAGDNVPKAFLPGLLANKYYVDELYNSLFVKPYNWLSEKILPKVETGIIDRIVNGLGENTVWLGEKVRRLQAGNISMYVFAMVSGIIFFIIINFYF
jgi:NADH-quinone oxidoreductase subunit L